MGRSVRSHCYPQSLQQGVAIQGPPAVSFLGWRAGWSVPSPGWGFGACTTGHGQKKSHGGISGPDKMPCKVWRIELVKMSMRSPGHFEEESPSAERLDHETEKGKM